MSDRYQKLALGIHALGTVAVFYIFSLVVTGALCIFGKQKEAEIFFVALVLMTVVVQGLKMIYNTPRPEERLIHPRGGAFPSGHAAATSFLVVTMSYLTFRLLNTFDTLLVGVVFILLAAIISLSRIVLKVHTSVQVVAGLTIGALVPLAVIFLFGF